MDSEPVDIIDLNIGENYLQDWEVCYAIREIIANALDEQKDGNIKIKNKGKDEYIIRDFGSGLKIKNFIMMGSEKATKEDVIGKFGVGLKDALGVLNNNGIEVKIRTAKYIFELNMKTKSEITNIETLHVYIYENNESNFKGTEFNLKNCKKQFMDDAKEEFLKYKNNKTHVMAETIYGDILEKENADSDIYINGMKINQDKDLRFSYNIKKVSSRLKQGINRERKYVSRNAYREDIKKIIDKCKEDKILDEFEEQLKRTHKGKNYSEIAWNKVLTKTCNHIIEKYNNKSVRFISNKDILDNKELYKVLSKSKDVQLIDVSDKIKMDIDRNRKRIISDKLFINDLVALKDQLLSKEDLTEAQRSVLVETIDILREVDLFKSDYISIDNIKVSKVPIGSTMDKGYEIIIPISSLNDLVTCAVTITNVFSSLGNNSADFKDEIVGNLIKIIHKRNMIINGN